MIGGVAHIILLATCGLPSFATSSFPPSAFFSRSSAPSILSSSFFLLSCFHTRRRLLRKRRCGGWPAWPLPRPSSVAGAAERQTDGRGRTSGSSPLPVLALCPFLELLLASSVSQPKFFSLPLSLHGLYPDPDAAKSQEILRSTPDLNQVRSSTPESILHSTLASLTRSIFSLQLLFHHTPATSYCGGVALRGASLSPDLALAAFGASAVRHRCVCARRPPPRWAR